MTLEEFIYATTKAGTNELTSTRFHVRGIKRSLKTKKAIKEAMRIKVALVKICKVTGDIHEADYKKFKWIKIK